MIVPWMLLLSVLTPLAAGSSRVMYTDTTLRNLEVAIDGFRITYDRLPTEQEGLDVLINKPADWPGTVPWEPMLRSDATYDGWGHKFVYVLMPASEIGFGIYSCGPDGVTSSAGNDQDDLNTWNKNAPWRAAYMRQARQKAMRPIIIMVVIIMVSAVVVGALFWRAARSEPESDD